MKREDVKAILAEATDEQQNAEDETMPNGERIKFNELITVVLKLSITV